MIAIIDYGMGNLHSVSKALERLGCDYVITAEAERLQQADGLLLPGVGAFGDAWQQLQKLSLDTHIRALAEEGKPLLGICLGMQLLFTSSEEGVPENGTRHEGLNLLSGHVRRFSGRYESGETYKVPHMGWNALHIKQPEHPIFRNVDGGYAYFVHSYYVSEMNTDELLAYTDYDAQVPAVVGRKHIVGMQFHPEKSSRTGMQLLNNFVSLCEGVNVP